jgi:signal transduction histidine kinase
VEDTITLGAAGMAVALLTTFILAVITIRYRQKLLRLKQQHLLLGDELARQSALLHASIQCHENERKRVGHHLHNEAGSMLANLRININRLTESIGNTPPAHDISQQCSQLIDKTISSVRTISHSLLPPGLELSGLGGALEELAGQVSRKGVLEVIIDNRRPQRVQELDQDTALMLFRVLQELLSNTIRHAGATRVFIYLNAEGQKLLIEYRDNGKGFELRSDLPGTGIRNMQSRLDMIGAIHTIHGNAGTGMQMDICVPQETLSTTYSQS